jgi:rod shape-determining protein MreD
MNGVLRPRGQWLIWSSLALALLLSVIPMGLLDVGRPLWAALFLAYWALYLPGRAGLFSAWVLGLATDVLHGSLLGQNALILSLITFLVLSLQRRLQMFPVWQQSMVLLVVFGLAQLIQLWLNTLAGDRPPTLVFLLPALVSALIWPWLNLLLRGLQQRFNVH